MGDLGETSSLNISESVHSTSLHVNKLDGTVNLSNHNYAGTSANKFTVADTAYVGAVKIEGARVDGAGIAAPAVDSSNFGLGEGGLVA